MSVSLRVGKYDRDGWVRASRRISAGAILLRGLTAPPAWLIAKVPRSHVGPAGMSSRAAVWLYRAGKVAAVVFSADDLLSSRLSFRSVAAGALTEAASTRRIDGFAPYLDHLYLYALGVFALDRLAPCSSESLPALSHYPSAIYTASGLVKLREAPRSWLLTGDIVENAIQLYAPRPVLQFARIFPPKWISRAVLVFEISALPVSVLGSPSLRRTYAQLGLAFHATNAICLRVSFWHLAVLHIPIIVAAQSSRG